MAAIVVVAGASHLGPLSAAEGGGSEPESASPKSPVRVNIVDYADAGEEPGTLKLAGVAIAGSAVYIFLDDKPFAKVIAGDDGQWSVEDKADLGDKVHTIRVEQYDDATRMLAARATFNIERAKPGGDKASPQTVEP
jgi:hypothetical protein